MNRTYRGWKVEVGSTSDDTLRIVDEDRNKGIMTPSAVNTVMHHLNWMKKFWNFRTFANPFRLRLSSLVPSPAGSTMGISCPHCGLAVRRLISG